jgi:hypothetical protein
VAHLLDVPPEVTAGACVVLLGADDEAPVLPVLPVEPVEVLPVFPEEEDEGVVAVPPPVVFPEVVELAALVPRCSCATTTPMPTVAPVVARRATRVRLRTRARA